MVIRVGTYAYGSQNVFDVWQRKKEKGETSCDRLRGIFAETRTLYLWLVSSFSIRFVRQVPLPSQRI